MRFPPVRRWIAQFAVVLTATFAVLSLPLPARAVDLKPTPPRPGRVIVHETLSGSWDRALRSAMPFVDRYTTSTMRRGRCNATNRCIIVRHGTAPGRARGWAAGGTSHRCTITVERIPGAPWSYRRALLEHELAHCFGVGHNARPTSRMYAPLVHRGKLVPRKFTAGERAILRRH